MTRRVHKQPKEVEVHVMFEPNREADHVLHAAYTILLPIRRRQVPTPTNSEATLPHIPSQMEERKHS
jgi:hypothetical protein